MATYPNQPQTAQYPITVLNENYPYYNTQSAAKAAGLDITFDVNKRVKRWSVPIVGDGDDAFVAGDYIKFVYHAQGIAMSKAEAFAVNIPPDIAPPANSVELSAAAYTMPELPAPARALYPNEKIIATPFGAIVQRTDLVNNSSGDMMVDKIYQDTQAIKAFLKI